MFEWLAANAATILISSSLFILMALAVRYLWKTSRSGGCVGCSECSGGCHGCSHCACKTGPNSVKRRHPHALS